MTRMEKGDVQVYTGDGKAQDTAASRLAVWQIKHYDRQGVPAREGIEV